VNDKDEFVALEDCSSLDRVRVGFRVGSADRIVEIFKLWVHLTM